MKATLFKNIAGLGYFVVQARQYSFVAYLLGPLSYILLKLYCVMLLTTSRQNSNCQLRRYIFTVLIFRSVSQLSPRPASSYHSQPSDGEGTAVTPNRPGSTKSGLSRDSGSGVSFVTVSGRKSRTKSSIVTSDVTAPVTHQVTFTVTVSAALPAGGWSNSVYLSLLGLLSGDLSLTYLSVVTDTDCS